jgi:DNA-binding transcriptional regulator YiaG
MEGADMRALRQALGLSRAKLAAEIGVHWNTINKWERGDNPIPEPIARLLRKIVEERTQKAASTS